MLKQIIRKAVNVAGYDIILTTPPDMEEPFLTMYNDCKNYTATSIERMFSMYKAARYIVETSVPGDIVECGVWKGGSSMMCASTLVLMKDTERKLFLYDTYAGMTSPTDKDVDYKGNKADRSQLNKWCVVPVADVKKAMLLTRYPPDNIWFVEGKVEDTIPGVIPDRIAVLRLDTDFYESTYHELKWLFPKLVPGGVLIVDDYGHFRGVREAVDKYLADNKIRILLDRIDYTGRIGIKQVPLC
jgi:hypothetical protein